MSRRNDPLSSPTNLCFLPGMFESETGVTQAILSSFSEGGRQIHQGWETEMAGISSEKLQIFFNANVSITFERSLDF